MTDREVEEINVMRAIVRQADAIAVIQKQLTVVAAERDALQAQLDAVPVAAIAFCVDAASYTYDAMVSEAKTWLETQVTP